MLVPTSVRSSTANHTDPSLISMPRPNNSPAQNGSPNTVRTVAPTSDFAEPSETAPRHAAIAATVRTNTPTLQPVSHTLMNTEIASCCPGSDSIATSNAKALSTRPGTM